MARTLLKVPVGDAAEEFIEAEVEKRDLAGVDLTADDGDKAEKATAEANFTVTLTWRRPAQPEVTGNGPA